MKDFMRFFQNKDANRKLSVVAFDLDGTLTKSKANLDKEMALLLCRLLERKKVFVIGGGSLNQFSKQFLKYLHCPKKALVNLTIAPTSGASMYKNKGGAWVKVYRYIFTQKEKGKIFSAFENAFRDIGYEKPKKVYGVLIEDRESQITFSALGSKAPLDKKARWNRKSDMRFIIKKTVEKYLPKFEVRVAGLTSVDVTRKGIDKAYGMRRFGSLVKVPIQEMVYVGDALYKGGNDAVVKKSGVRTLQVKGLEDTKSFVRFILQY